MYWSSLFFIYFIFLLIDSHLSQHHLLRRLSFLTEPPFPFCWTSISWPFVYIFLDSLFFTIYLSVHFAANTTIAWWLYSNNSQLQVILLHSGICQKLHIYLISFSSLACFSSPFLFVLGTQLNWPFTLIPCLWVFFVGNQT